MRRMGLNCLIVRAWRNTTNLYLKCGTLLLACIFQEFCKISHDTYGVDCTHRFSVSKLAVDAFKLICRESSIELLSDRRNLDSICVLLPTFQRQQQGVSRFQIDKANNIWADD